MRLSLLGFYLSIDVRAIELDICLPTLAMLEVIVANLRELEVVNGVEVQFGNP